MQPCPHLGFGLLGSMTGEKPVVQSRLVCGAVTTAALGPTQEMAPAREGLTPAHPTSLAGGRVEDVVLWGETGTEGWEPDCHTVPRGVCVVAPPGCQLWAEATAPEKAACT